MIWRRVRALLANLLLAGGSLAFVLLAFELGLRVAGYRALHEMYSAPHVFWTYDAQLGWFHEPGARGRYIGPRPWPVEFEAAVEINSRGLRGPELAPPGRELRVLFLGDSMVAAFEVDQPETFVALLEDDLALRVGERVRTINGGVRGYGTDQTLLFYEERGRELEPDVVVIFVSGNDLSDNRTLHETRRPFGKPALVPEGDGRLRRVGSPVPRYGECEEVSLSAAFDVVRTDDLASRLLCHAQIALFDHSALLSFATISIPWDAVLLAQLYHFGNPHHNSGASPEDDVWIAHTHAILLELIRAIRVDGARVVLTGGPIELDRFGGEALAGPGTLVRNLKAVWDAPYREVRWEHDSHFNREGHRRVAGILAPAIETALSSASSADPAIR